VTLAEKVVGAGPNARRAVTVQWDDADAISSWRYGLATATGLPIPERLMKPANPRVWSWEARAPMVPIEERVKPAQVAAALGVFSAESLVEIYSALGDSTDPADFASSLPGKLRGAYVGTFADRLGAMRGLWGNSKDPIDWYAQRILTATAAARLAPSDSAGKDVFDLVASMLAAGLDNEAAHWAATVGGMSGAEADRAWGLLAVGSPYGEAGTRRFDGFRGSDDSEAKQRSRFLFAALAGLGRIPEGSQAGMAEQLGVPIGREDAWSRMLDTATKAGQPGTVVLLSAVGMQTHDWSGVPPEHLYRIVRAMRQVGLEFDARMIAAEALSRV
jgi:hypothetical protein